MFNSFVNKKDVVRAFKVKDVIAYATNQWYRLPEVLRDKYEKRDIVVTDKEISIKNGDVSILAGIDDIILLSEDGVYSKMNIEEFNQIFLRHA